MSDLVQTPQRTNQAAFDSPFIKRDIKFVNPNIRYSVKASDSFNTPIQESPKIKVGAYGTLPNIIKPRGDKYNSDLYDDLINIILNAKKDIKYHPTCVTKDGAKKYAKSHGFRVSDTPVDVNNDGIEDIVVYNKAGNPVMINGYTFAASDFPYKNKYYQETPSNRAKIGGYNGWKKALWQDYDIDDPNGPKSKRPEEVKYGK